MDNGLSGPAVVNFVGESESLRYSFNKLGKKYAPKVLIKNA